MADTPEHLRRLADAIVEPVADDQFSRDTFVEAARLAHQAPASLTDTHLAHLALYVSASEITALLQRRAEAVQRRADQAFADAQQRTTDARAAADARLPVSIATIYREARSFEEVCAMYPDEPATLGLVADIAAFVNDMHARNMDRNEKIAALEARTADLVKQLAEMRVAVDAWAEGRS